MKKCLVAILTFCFLCGAVLPVAAAILPADSRVIHGKIVKINREQKHHDFLITVKRKKETIQLFIPAADPHKLMPTVRKFRQKPATIIYTVPAGEITSVSRGRQSKTRYK